MAKIIVVSASNVQLIAVEHLLKMVNHEVATYDSVYEMESNLKAENPDLILMDIVMSVKNGYQLCRQLKEDDRYMRIPIILCAEAQDVRETEKFWSKQMGANGFLQKPIKTEDLFKAVDRLLSR